MRVAERSSCCISSRYVFIGFISCCEFQFYVRLHCAFLSRRDREPTPPDSKEILGSSLR